MLTDVEARKKLAILAACVFLLSAKPDQSELGTETAEVKISAWSIAARFDNRFEDWRTNKWGELFEEEI